MNAVQIPVRLQIENIQSIINGLKNELGNLKIGSAGFKAMENSIRVLQRELDKLQVQTSKPFMTENQFSQANRSVNKLEEEIEKVQINASRIKFSDLQLNSEQQSQLKAIEDQINAIKASLKGVKEAAKQDFLGTDFGKMWTDMKPGDATRTLEQITNHIRAEVDKQSEELKKAEAAVKQYQAAFDAAGRASGIQGAAKKGKDPFTVALGGDFDSFFSTNKNGRTAFKAGQQSAFEEWLKNNLQVDPQIAADLVKKSAGDIRKAFNDETSALRQDLAKKANDKALAKTNFDTANRDYSAKNASLQQMIQILNAAIGANKNVETSEEALRAKLMDTKAASDELKESFARGAQNSQTYSNANQKMAQELSNFRRTLAESNSAFLQQQRTVQNFNAIKMAIVNFMGFRQVLNLVKQGVRDALNHIKELDTVMNKISIVTNMSTGDLWKQIDSYSEMAQKYGVSIKGAYEVSQIYYQQGIDTANVMTLTNETLKLAKISGLDYAQTTDYMTTALRGFKMEMSEASTVVDVYSNLAAHTAVSSEELAVAMSKTASSMESVGSSFQETSAMIGTMVAVTRESATNIGSALKSIASRYGEMKKDPMSLVDEEGDTIAFNKVDAALQSVGISMKTADGQFRNFTDVIIELSEKWNDLESTQQRYIATQFAGNRQQSRFLALVSNADLLKTNLGYAEDSEDTGTLQALKALDSIESKTEQVRVAYQQMYTTIGAENMWKGILDGAKNVMNTLNALPKSFTGIPLGAIAMVADFVNVIKTIGVQLLSGISSIWDKMLPTEMPEKAASLAEQVATIFADTLKSKTEEKNPGEAMSNKVGEQIDKTSKDATKPLSEQRIATDTTDVDRMLIRPVVDAYADLPPVRIPTTFDFDLGEFFAQINNAESLTKVEIKAGIDLASTLDDIDNTFIPTLQSAISQIDLTAPNAQGYLTDIIESFLNEASTVGPQLREAFANAGEQGIAGLVAGLQASDATGASASVGTAVIEALKSAMGVHSPSVLTLLAGQNVVEGLIQGMSSKVSEAMQSGSEAGKAVIEGLEKELKMNASAFDELKQSITAGLESLGDDVVAPDIKRKLIGEIQGQTFQNFKEGTANAMYYEAAIQRQRGMEGLIDFGKGQSRVLALAEGEHNPSKEKYIKSLTYDKYLEAQTKDNLSPRAQNLINAIRRQPESKDKDGWSLPSKSNIQTDVALGDRKDYPLQDPSAYVREEARRAKMEDILDDRRRNALAREDREEKTREAQAQEEAKTREAARIAAEKQQQEKEGSASVTSDKYARLTPEYIAQASKEELDELEQLSNQRLLEKSNIPTNKEDAMALYNSLKTLKSHSEFDAAARRFYGGWEFDTQGNLIQKPAYRVSSDNIAANNERFEISRLIEARGQQLENESIQLKVQDDTEFQRAIAEAQKEKQAEAERLQQTANREAITENGTFKKGWAIDWLTEQQNIANKQFQERTGFEAPLLDEKGNIVYKNVEQEQGLSQYTQEIEEYRQKMQALQSEFQERAKFDGVGVSEEEYKQLVEKQGQISEPTNLTINTEEANEKLEETKEKTEEVKETTEQPSILTTDSTQSTEAITEVENKAKEVTEEITNDEPEIKVNTEPAKENLEELKQEVKETSSVIEESTPTTPTTTTVQTSTLEASATSQEVQNPVQLPEVDNTTQLQAIQGVIDALIEAGKISEEEGAKIKASLENVDPSEATHAAEQLAAALQNTGNAADTAGKKMSSMSLGTLGSAIRMLSSLTGLSQQAKGALTLLGGAITLLGVKIKAVDSMSKTAAKTNPWMGIAMGIMAVWNGLSLIIETPAEQLERLNKEAEELSNKAKEAKADYKALDNGIKKIDELEEKRYESQESAEEYQKAIDDLTSKFPQMIAGFDSAGNIIVDATNAEELLAQARSKSAQATYEAAQAELTAARKQAEVSKGKVSEQIGSLYAAVSNANTGYENAGKDEGLMGAVARAKAAMENGIDWSSDEGKQILNDITSSYATYNKTLAEHGITRNPISEELIDNLYNQIKTSISDTGDISGYERSVIGAWQQTQENNGRAWEYLEESAAGAAFVTNQIVKDFSDYEDLTGNTYDINDTNYGLIAKEDYIALMNNFWLNLNEDQQKLFNSMFSDQKNYSAEDFAREFKGIEGFDSIWNLIEQYYSNSYDSIQERVKNNTKDIETELLKESHTANGERLRAGREHATQDSLNFDKMVEQVSNRTEEAYVKNLTSVAEHLNDAGYKNNAKDILVQGTKLFNALETLDGSVQASLYNIINEKGLNTAEGINDIIEEVKNNDKIQNKEQIIGYLNNIKNTIIPNLALELQTATDQFLNGWKDGSKTLKSLTSGVSITDVDSVINSSAGKAMGLSLDSFKKDGDKLILSAEDANTYIQKYFELERQTLAERTAELAQMAEQFGTMSKDGHLVIDRQKYRQGYTFTEEEIAQLDSLLGGAGRMQEYLGEDGSLEKAADFWKALRNAYSNVHDGIVQYGTYLDWGASQVEKENQWELGDYSSIEKDTSKTITALMRMSKSDLAAEIERNPDVKNAVKKAQDAATNLFKDLIAKPLGEIDLSSYEGLPAEIKSRVEALIKGESQETEYEIIEDYATALGLDVEEVNDIILGAYEDSINLSKKSADALKDLQFMDKSHFSATSSELKDFAKKFGLNISDLLKDQGEDTIAYYDAQLGEYIVDFSKIDGLDLSQVQGYKNIVTDSINELFKNIAQLITNGLSGSLTNVKAASLQDYVNKMLGEDTFNLDFTKTSQGLKLSAQSATLLYTKLKQVDTLQAQLIFDDLRKSLEESNDAFKTTTALTAHIKDLSDKISAADEKTSDARLKQYEAELEVAKEILAVRSTEEDSSFDFMSNKIPGAQNNPLKYAENWGKAWSTIRDSFKASGKDKAKIEYQDFYNIMTEMGNIASKSGTPIKLGADTFITDAESASAAIQKGCESLSVAADGSVKVDLSKFGLDFATGADTMKNNVNEGIKAMAHSQVEMLDGMIQLLETIVAMEQLKDVDVDNSGTIDLGEIFDINVDTGEIEGWSQKWQDTADKILKEAEINKDLDNALEQVKVNGESLKKKLKDTKKAWTGTTEEAKAYQAIMNAFYKAALSGDYDTDHIFQSIKDVLAGTDFEGEIEVGDLKLKIINGGIVLERDKDGNYIVDGNTYTNEKAAIGATAKKGIDALKNAETEVDEETGHVTVKGSIVTDFEYDQTQGIYNITFSDGTTASSDSQEGINLAIATYAEMIGAEVDSGSITEGKPITFKIHQNAGAEINVTVTDTDVTVTSSTGSADAEDVKKKVETVREKEKKKVEDATKTEAETVEIEGVSVKVKEGETPTLDLTGITFKVEGAPEGIELESTPDIKLPEGTTDIKIDLTGKTLKSTAESFELTVPDGITTLATGTVINIAQGVSALATATGLSVTIDELTHPTPYFNGIEEPMDIGSIGNVKGSVDTLTLEGYDDLKIPEELNGTATLTATVDDQATTDLTAIKELADDVDVSDPNIDVEEKDAKSVEQKLKNVAKAALNIPNNVLTTVALSGESVFITAVDRILNKIKEIARVWTVTFKANRTGTWPQVGGNVPQATGNFGNAMATGGTLMGELGPELVVQSGRYFIAGQNGAEFVNLAPDAIVFNHLQTEQLLQKGMSNTRGKAVTNERVAAAYATGNINGGPAMASASAALAALKQLRAMWKALEGMDVSDLAGKGGGGGGGGGGAKDPARQAWIAQVERWYNWMQEIAQLEKEITHEETLRTKISSEMNKDGEAYYKSQVRSIQALQQEMVNQEALNISRRKYFEERRKQLNENNGPFNQLYSFDENGQLKYSNNVVNGQQGGFAFLSDLMSVNDFGTPLYSVEEQYNKLVAAGFEAYMKYDSSGKEIKPDEAKEGEEQDLTSFYTSSIQAFWDLVDSQKEEMQTLHDDIIDGENKLLELQTQQNEILKEIKDNQMQLEDKILKAIEDQRQRAIDNLSKEREALEASTSKYIQGLSDALNKEKDMYSANENSEELNKMRRQLAILQRSGGSGSEIRQLQESIRQKEQDTYFEEQQRQIDAIQEASNLQLERLDQQIDLMTETLEYQKLYGQLWGDVYQVMEQSPKDIAQFIFENDSSLWGLSPLKSTEELQNALFTATQWDAFRTSEDTFFTNTATYQANEKQTIKDAIYGQGDYQNWPIFDEAMGKVFGQNWAKIRDSYRTEFQEKYADHNDITQVTKTLTDAKSDLIGALSAAMQSHETTNTTSMGTGGGAGGGTEETNTGGTSGGKTNNPGPPKEYSYWVGGTEYSTAADANAALKKLQQQTKENYNKNKETVNSYSYYTEMQQAMQQTVKKKEKVKTKAFGGMVDETGMELVHAKEAVLTPQQASMLRNDIMGSNRNSLMSLLLDFRNAYEGIESSSYINANEGITIENATVNMNVEQIANDYDAQRAGEQALEKMLQIARKTSAKNSIRR